ncbi:MAG: tRNA pseudouridine synthase B [Candidatus Anoxychlamydiales bacterium]|nr:tRNA pseudouridine synthase B [Candidatus Anoxychlamydiales bacterium]
MNSSYEGIVLVNKSINKSSFSIIAQLRKILNVKKIGHAGTLDPLATGLMIILVGKKYTRQASLFTNHEKEYIAKIHLGYTTKSYDSEMELIKKSDYIPSLDEIEKILEEFQGEVLQTPPMFSAKKIKGKRLYKLARQDIEVFREPISINLKTTLISYSYPFLELKITCSKGTYIRSIANDLGIKLNTGAYLYNLTRTKSGKFDLKDAISQDELSIDTVKFIS